jgi:hypothetical protein
MPKTKAIVPLTHPETGEAVAAGADISLNDDDYLALRLAGSVEASEADQKAAASDDAEGNYRERTGREDTASTKTDEEPPKKGKS